MSLALSELMSGFLDLIEAVPVISIADDGSNNTKIVDSGLTIYGDDYFVDWWVYVTSGNAKGDMRMIESFIKLTGTIDPYVDFSAAVAGGNRFEVHKYNPDTIKRCINDALASIVTRPDPRTGRKHKLYRKIVFTDLGHSLLLNDAASGQPYIDVYDVTLFYKGQKITISDNNRSEDAEIKDAVSDIKLELTAKLTNSYDTTKNAQVYAKSAAYFNLGGTIGEARVTGVFTQADRNSQRKRQVGWQVIHDPDCPRMIYFPSSISVDSGTWIIEAVGSFERLSSPSDICSIDDGKVNVLYAEAAYHLYSKLANDISAGDTVRLEALAQKYRNMVDIDFRGQWMPLPREHISLKTDSDYD